ncbi:MAG: ABC transporter substrate-binding protein [Azospirillaceae bacterium]
MLRLISRTAAVMALLLVWTAPPANAAGDQAGAEAFMADLGEGVISTLRTDPTFDQALGDFRPLFTRSFDMPVIGRFVLGPNWRRATEAQQVRFIELFTEWVVRTYTRRFHDYTGETFEVQGSRTDGDSDVIVSTRINRGGGAPSVAVDWRVRDYGGGSFQILDVVIEGVSQGATQRNEYASIIQRNGGSIDALLSTLQNAVGG